MQNLFKLVVGLMFGVFALTLGSNSGFSAAQTPHEQNELLSVVETSCKKSCVGGRGEKAFCTSYCQCVSGQVKELAKNSGVFNVVSNKNQHKTLIQRCSGQTAMKFFSRSCRDKCNGAPKCNSYCSCLENKIKYKRKLSNIGSFFIQLGKNVTSATDRLKRYEASCMR